MTATDFVNYIDGLIPSDGMRSFEEWLLGDESHLKLFTAFKDIYVMSAIRQQHPATEEQMYIADRICSGKFSDF